MWLESVSMWLFNSGIIYIRIEPGDFGGVGGAFSQKT